jgi:hypothetical protein
MKETNQKVVFVYVDNHDQLIIRSYTPQIPEIWRRRIYEERN